MLFTRNMTRSSCGCSVYQSLKYPIPRIINNYEYFSNSLSGITATKENGYYPSNDKFILDFEEESVSTTVDTNFLRRDKAGILISGLLQFPKGFIFYLCSTTYLQICY